MFIYGIFLGFYAIYLFLKYTYIMSYCTVCINHVLPILSILNHVTIINLELKWIESWLCILGDLDPMTPCQPL